MDVVVAAGGASWEAGALAEIEASESLRLVRRCVDAADLLSVAGTRLARLAFVDCGLAGLDLDVVSRLAEADVLTVAIGSSAPELGIDTYLDLGQLDAAVHLTQQAQQPVAAPEHAGRIVAVWGPAGAPGRSTLAVNLTAEWAAQGHRCVLVDADTYGGAIAQILSILDEVSGLMATCRSANAGRPQAIDDLLLDVDAFHLLTGISRPDMWTHIRPAALERVLRELAGRYDLVVVDTGFGLEPEGVGPARDRATTTVLDCADQVVVVGRADPVGMTRLVRSLSDGIGWQGQTAVVLNRFRASAGWRLESFTELLRSVTGLPTTAVLSADEAAVDKSMLLGRPLRRVAPQSALTRELAELARYLAPVAASV